MKTRVGLICMVSTCVLLAGCIIAPIPSPTRRVGPSGKIGELNLKSFTPGKTTRDEVAKQLAPVDTGVMFRNAYWARWEKSKWTWVAAVGGYGGAAGGASRFWSAENLIAEFDDKGVLTNWKVVRDTEMGPELARLIDADHRWNDEQRKEIDVVHCHFGANPGATLALQREYVELVEYGKRTINDASGGTMKHTFKTDPSEIIEVTTGNTEHETKDVDVAVIRVNLRFKTAKPVGQTLKILTNPEHLVEILSYVHQRAPNAVTK
jgi:hypothetical protein